MAMALDEESSSSCTSTALQRHANALCSISANAHAAMHVPFHVASLGTLNSVVVWAFETLAGNSKRRADKNSNHSQVAWSMIEGHWLHRIIGAALGEVLVVSPNHLPPSFGSVDASNAQLIEHLRERWHRAEPPVKASRHRSVVIEYEEYHADDPIKRLPGSFCLVDASRTPSGSSFVRIHDIFSSDGASTATVLFLVVAYESVGEHATTAMAMYREKHDPPFLLEPSATLSLTDTVVLDHCVCIVRSI